MRKNILVSIVLLSAVGFGCQSNNQALLDASGRHDVVAHPEAIKALLAKGANVNVVDEDGTPPLYWAADKDDVEAVKILLAAGAKVDATTENGEQAIHVAAAPINDDPELVKILLAAGAKANAVSKNGTQPIYYAAENGEIETLKVLLANGAKIDAADNEGIQPIHCAAQCGKVEMVHFLLANGAKALAKDKQGRTASVFAYSAWMEKFRGPSATFAGEHGLSPIFLAGEKDTPEAKARRESEAQERFVRDEKMRKALAAFLKDQEAKETAATPQPTK